VMMAALQQPQKCRPIAITFNFPADIDFGIRTAIKAWRTSVVLPFGATALQSGNYISAP